MKKILSIFISLVLCVSCLAFFACEDCDGTDDIPTKDKTDEQVKKSISGEYIFESMHARINFVKHIDDSEVVETVKYDFKKYDDIKNQTFGDENYNPLYAEKINRAFAFSFFVLRFKDDYTGTRVYDYAPFEMEEYVEEYVREENSNIIYSYESENTFTVQFDKCACAIKLPSESETLTAKYSGEKLIFTPEIEDTLFDELYYIFKPNKMDEEDDRREPITKLDMTAVFTCLSFFDENDEPITPNFYAKSQINDYEGIDEYKEKLIELFDRYKKYVYKFNKDNSGSLYDGNSTLSFGYEYKGLDEKNKMWSSKIELEFSNKSDKMYAYDDDFIGVLCDVDSKVSAIAYFTECDIPESAKFYSIEFYDENENIEGYGELHGNSKYFYNVNFETDVANWEGESEYKNWILEEYNKYKDYVYIFNRDNTGSFYNGEMTLEFNYSILGLDNTYEFHIVKLDGLEKGEIYAFGAGVMGFAFKNGSKVVIVRFEEPPKES